jgi:hypothetical protein
MDDLLVKLEEAGTLTGYPILYDSTVPTNPTFHLTVSDNHRILARLGCMVIHSKVRKPWEPKENCIFILSFINVAGYKGMGADLMRVLIYEAKRLKFPIQLMATGDVKQAYKLYKFYEKLGFTPIKDTTVHYEYLKSESKMFRLE